MAIPKKKTFKLTEILPKIFFGIAILLALAGVVYAGWIINNAQQQEIAIAQRKSEGEKTIFAISGATGDKEVSLDKKEAMEMFAKKDCPNAVLKWDVYLKKQRNDPEAVIYRNNAKVCGDKNALKIAVVLPINPVNIGVANEMLRGVAMAQNDVNDDKGAPLKIMLVNDENQPDIASKVASSLVEDNSILAVVGHNSSDASIAAAKVYQPAKLVMISPTSTSNDFSKEGNFIFRTVPNGSFQARKLSEHTVKGLDKKRVAICASDAEATKSLKEDFVKYVKIDGGTVIPIDCQINPDLKDISVFKVMQKMADEKVEALLLAPRITHMQEGIEIANVAQKRFLLLSDSTLYSQAFLKGGKENIVDMRLTVPWSYEHTIDNPDASLSAKRFITQAKELWGAVVNWRSATSYDATLAVAIGLRNSKENANIREKLQNVLSSDNFVIKDGIVGTIAFEKNGDRADPKIFLVKVSKADNNIGYKFEAVK